MATESVQIVPEVSAEDAANAAAAAEARAAAIEAARVIDDAPGENAETEAKVEAPVEPKPEKTPEQKEIDRLRKAVDRKTRQREEARAEAAQLRNRLTNPENADTVQTSNDSDTLSLTRAQLQEYVTAEAKRLAPTLKEQDVERERRQSVIDSLADSWGQEKFDKIASDLDDAFGGLKTSAGQAKPAVEAIFESDNPSKVIEWLADPENLDEAERISRLSAVQAGKAIAKLEMKLSSVQRKSNVPPPLEPIRGGGHVVKSLGDMSFEEFSKRRREQIMNRH